MARTTTASFQAFRSDLELTTLQHATLSTRQQTGRNSDTRRLTENAIELVLDHAELFATESGGAS